MTSTRDPDHPRYYPDLPPDTCGDLEMKLIERADGMSPIAPTIKWGEEYASWPVERRLDFAERLASAMNHAADVMQRERNALGAENRRLQLDLEQAKRARLEHGDIAHREIQDATSREQNLASQLVAQREKTRDIARRALSFREAASYAVDAPSHLEPVVREAQAKHPR